VQFVCTVSRKVIRLYEPTGKFEGRDEAAGAEVPVGLVGVEGSEVCVAAAAGPDDAGLLLLVQLVEIG